MNLTKEECENSYSNLSVIRELLNINGLLTNTYDKSMVTFASLINEYFEIAKEKECLEKALDKACEELENLSYVKGLGQVGKNFKEWKAWCLKNVD